MIRQRLTPRVRAQPTTWGQSTAPTLLDQEAARGAIALRELEQNHGRRPGGLDPDKLTEPADLSALMAATHPLRDMIPFDLPAREIADVLAVTLSDSIERITATAAKRKSSTIRGCFRTFHVNAEISIGQTREILAPLPIQHEWMASFSDPTPAETAYTLSTPGHWTPSDSALTSASLRRWSHALSEQSKRLDLFVSAHDPIGSIIFALTALSDNGSAAVRLGALTPALVGAICVFSQYFGRTEYVHSAATDTAWVVGIARIIPPSARVKKALNEWLDNGATTSPFPDGCASEDVINALCLGDAAARRWREDRYQRVLSVFLPHDQGRAAVEDMLERCAATFPRA